MSRYWLLPFVLLLAACGGTPTESAQLPTVAQLPTLTDTVTPSPTYTVTPSLTPTFTTTPSITPSPTITRTPTPTITDTPTPEATLTPSNTPDLDALSLLAALAAQATVLPPGFSYGAQPQGNLSVATPAANLFCTYPPPGGFGPIFASDATLVQQIGCAVGAPPVATSVASASQRFERGAMFWLAGTPNVIYVLFSDGRFQRLDDTFTPGVDPESGGEQPPPGLFEPVRGFGKVWREAPNVRTSLGWATEVEAGATATIQLFERGRMVSLPQRGETIVLVEDAGGLTGTWRALPGNY